MFLLCIACISTDCHMLNHIILKIGYSRICACTKIPVFCLPPGPADENKGSRPSLNRVANRVIVIVFKWRAKE